LIRMKKLGVPTTLLDVASLAGVSPATVSRALNQPEIVSARTLERVQRAVRETGYEANEAARHLRRRRSDTLLVMVGEIPSRFIFRVLMAFEAKAAEDGYSLLISSSAYHQERGQHYYSFIQKGLADGILTFGGSPGIISNLSRIDESLPIVSVNEFLADKAIPFVSIDDLNASRKVARHLVELGHTSLGHVTGPPETSSGKMRLQGFCEELAVSGLKPDWISRQDYNLESGERAAREWLALSRRPTAVFCSCDEVALGFMATLHREGVRIPQEVSVVGFDDIPFAGCSYPKLTTIQQPHQSIASAALQMILQRIQNDQAKVENCFLPGTLVVRESTAPLRGTA
jgi:LacI family repressor for deo operon, udp, cdd, tsx, nupC, and nupG